MLMKLTTGKRKMGSISPTLSHCLNAFSREQDEKLFSEHKFGKRRTEFGEMHANLSLKHQ